MWLALAKGTFVSVMQAELAHLRLGPLEDSLLQPRRQDVKELCLAY